jgi:hypothetical protein
MKPRVKRQAKCPCRNLVSAGALYFHPPSGGENVRRPDLASAAAAAVTTATATVAAATAAVASATTTATAGAVFARLGFIDVQSAATDFTTVELLNRSSALFSAGHFDKAEAT